MPAAFEGEPLEIGFNPEFLKDGIESVEGDEVLLRLISPLRPGSPAAGRQRRLPLPGDADSAQRLCLRWLETPCSSPPPRPHPAQPRAAAARASSTGIVSLVGDNGAGKTNLLEAVYFALTGRSFRTARPPRADPLRRLAGPRRGAGARRGRHRADAARLGQPRRGPPPSARRQPGRPGDARAPPPPGRGLLPGPADPGQGPAGGAPRPPRPLRRRPLALARGAAPALRSGAGAAQRAARPGRRRRRRARPSSTPGTRPWPRPRRR